MNAQQQKTRADVFGVKTRCVNYCGCPICYGCRSASSTDPDCIMCKEDGAKKNICNTNLHRSDLINRLVTKNVVNFDGSTTFISNKTAGGK